MKSGTSPLQSDLKTYLELRRLTKRDLSSLTQFFDEVVQAELDASFHPHPFDLHTTKRICTYAGIDLYSGAFTQSSITECMIGYLLLRGWDRGYDIPSLGLCVLPNYQGQGVGSLLLNLAITTAKLRGSSAIRLKVYPDNNIAISLYKRNGFRFIESIENGQLVGYLNL